MPMIPAGTRLRYPFRILLSVLFSTLVLAAGATIAWIGYAGSRDLALAAADDAFGHVGRETQSSVNESLRPVGSLAELLALEPLARAGSLAARLEALPVMRLGDQRRGDDRRGLRRLRRRQLLPAAAAARRQGACVFQFAAGQRLPGTER